MIKHNERNQGFVVIRACKIYLTWVAAFVHPLNILDIVASFSSQGNYLFSITKYILKLPLKNNSLCYRTSYLKKKKTVIIEPL